MHAQYALKMKYKSETTEERPSIPEYRSKVSVVGRTLPFRQLVLPNGNCLAIAQGVWAELGRTPKWRENQQYFC
jgi:hypothetical protein